MTRDTNQRSHHRSDEIELMGKQRKPSQPPSVRAQASKEAAAPCPPDRPELSPEDAGYSSSEYSPMHGGGLAASRAAAEEEADTETGVPLLSASSGPDTEVSRYIYISMYLSEYLRSTTTRMARRGPATGRATCRPAATCRRDTSCSRLAAAGSSTSGSAPSDPGHHSLI